MDLKTHRSAHASSAGPMGYLFLGESSTAALRARTAGFAAAMSGVFGCGVYDWMPISSRRLTFRLSSQLDLQLHDPTNAPFRWRRCRMGNQDRLSFRRTRVHWTRLDLLLCSRAQGSKLCRGASKTSVCSHSQYLILYHLSTARRALQQAYPGAEIRHDQDLPTRAGAGGLRGFSFTSPFSPSAFHRESTGANDIGKWIIIFRLYSTLLAFCATSCTLCLRYHHSRPAHRLHCH